MDINELQRAAEHFMAEPYLTATLEFLENFNKLQDERNSIKSELDEVSKRFTALIQQNSAIAADNERLTEELIRACAELSVIKKQEPVGYAAKIDAYHEFFHSEAEALHQFERKKDAFEVMQNEIARTDFWVEPFPIFRYPVHQRSFTISGIGTFCADSELEITYLERLHGVGGKANLKAVDEEHF